MLTRLVLDWLLVINSTSTHLVWLQRHWWYKKYTADNHLMMFQTFAVTFTLNIVAKVTDKFGTQKSHHLGAGSIHIEPVTKGHTKNGTMHSKFKLRNLTKTSEEKK